MIVSLCNILMYVFFAAAVIGVVISFFLLKYPEKLIKFDNRLNKSIDVDSKGIVVDSKIDIEYLFFNNHILTSVILILLSIVLYFLSMRVKGPLGADWYVNYIFDFVRYLFYSIAVIGIMLGVFILVSPKNAFLFIRTLNKYIYSINTKDVDTFLQSDIIERKLYLKYNVFFALLILIFSLVLIFLILHYWHR